MNLYTGKGDKGTTKLFKTPKGKRVSKDSPIFNALGSVDELNSFLGFCKTRTGKYKALFNIIHATQKNLFIIQAEIAGADQKIETKKIKELESIIEKIDEKVSIDSFKVPGGNELSALMDIARTMARKTEREAVKINKEKQAELSEETLVYLNRLSSFFYALARYLNLKNGFEEESPDYR